MKNNERKLDQFTMLGDILNPTKKDFEQMYVCPDYAVNTLINGNISECVKHLRDMIGTGLNGMSYATEQLMKIKEQCPEKYEYIHSKVYSFRG